MIYHGQTNGVTLEQGLTFQQHITNRLNKFRIARNKLFSLIARNSNLSIKNEILIYTSYLRPILTYTCMMWSYAAKSHVKLPIKVQNSTIWQILDIPWYVLNFHIFKEIDIGESDLKRDS